MTKKKIYIDEWLKFKPHKNLTATDIYYLKICNEVKTAIESHDSMIVLQAYLDNEEISELACFLTSYFEDLISETNIWNSFIVLHERLYQKKLPFYNTDEYYEEEINNQDLSFLIWYFINTSQDEKFIAPYNTFIIELADNLMTVFEGAWEYAPANKYLKSFYQLDENEQDFYKARNLIDTILFKTYLFYPDTFKALLESEYDLIKGKLEKKNLIMILNENRDSFLQSTYTKLLSLKGKDWAAEIIGKNSILNHYFSSMQQTIKGLFFYKGQDPENLIIEHIATSKKFNITKKSFDHSDSLKDVDSVLYMGIAKWKDEWWFSGVFFQQAFDANLVLNEKNSLPSKMALNFLDHQEKDTNETLRVQLKAFIEYNNGSQIAFMQSDKINSFISGYIEYYNTTLNISTREKEKALKRARDNGFFEADKKYTDLSEKLESALVFFNPKGGAEIAFDVNCAFQMAGNPFYDSTRNYEDTLHLLISDEMSTELAIFCIDNGKNDLPFFKNENGGKKYLNDIDFLLRFWKKNNYHSKPQVTFTGK